MSSNSVNTANNSSMYRVSVSYHTTAEGGPENGYGDTYFADEDCYVEFNEDEDVMIEDALDCAADLSDPLPELDDYDYEIDPEYADVEIDHDGKVIDVTFNVMYRYSGNNNYNSNQNGGKRRTTRKSRKTRKTSRKSRKASRKSRKVRKSRKAQRKNRK
jgi:hypothetical protein